MGIYVNGSLWKVADFSKFVIGDFHPVLWEFDVPTGNNPIRGKVSAAGFWAGTYTQETDDSLLLETTGKWGTDSFRVTFPSPAFFIATKNGQVYRLGKVVANP